MADESREWARRIERSNVYRPLDLGRSARPAAAPRSAAAEAEPHPLASAVPTAAAAARVRTPEEDLRMFFRMASHDNPRGVMSEQQLTAFLVNIEGDADGRRAANLYYRDPFDLEQFWLLLNAIANKNPRVDMYAYVRDQVNAYYGLPTAEPPRAEAADVIRREPPMALPAAEADVIRREPPAAVVISRPSVSAVVSSLFTMEGREVLPFHPFMEILAPLLLGDQLTEANARQRFNAINGGNPITSDALIAWIERQLNRDAIIDSINNLAPVAAPVAEDPRAEADPPRTVATGPHHSDRIPSVKYTWKQLIDALKSTRAFGDPGCLGVHHVTDNIVDIPGGCDNLESILRSRRILVIPRNSVCGDVQRFRTICVNVASEIYAESDNPPPPDMWATLIGLAELGDLPHTARGGIRCTGYYFWYTILNVTRIFPEYKVLWELLLTRSLQDSSEGYGDTDEMWTIPTSGGVSCGAGISERLLCWLSPALHMNDPSPFEVTLAATPAMIERRRMGLLRTWLQEYMRSEDATEAGFQEYTTRKIGEDSVPYDDKRNWPTTYEEFMRREGSETIRMMSGGRKTRRVRKQTKKRRHKKRTGKYRKKTRK